MKALFWMSSLLMAISPGSNAQLLKKLGDKVKTAADKATDKIIGSEKPGEGKTAAEAATVAGDSKASLGLYAAYDFIPGDSVLFSDDMQTDEANEIPSKWILDKGRAEVNEINGERKSIVSFLDLMLQKINFL